MTSQANWISVGVYHSLTPETSVSSSGGAVRETAAYKGYKHVYPVKSPPTPWVSATTISKNAVNLRLVFGPDFILR